MKVQSWTITNQVEKLILTRTYLNLIMNTKTAVNKHLERLNGLNSSKKKNYILRAIEDPELKIGT
jgi:hypothetical protein